MKALLTGVLFFVCIAGYSQEPFAIHFDFNKYQLTEAARSALDSFIMAEKSGLGNLSINLNGHCDAIGSDEYNNKLSKRRVAAVKKYLLSKDIGAYQIGDEIGYGKRKPLNENRTDEERQLNRRVEISFIRVVRAYPPGTISLIEKIADSAATAGTNIVLRNINFVGGMHQFLPESTPMLKELLDAMKIYPKLVIRVEGHICCQPGKGDGTDGETGIDNLSEARAKAVMDYLLANGIEQERIGYKGFGHSSPIYPYPEKTDEERIANRRVEIKIVSK